MKTILFAFSGKIGSGKTTSAAQLENVLKAQYGDAIYVQHINFADRLKELSAHIFRFDVQLCYTSHGKQQFIEAANMTVGEILQALGNSFRNMFGVDFWLDELKKTIDERAKQLPSTVHACVFLIGDVRYPNEADFVRANNGILVRLEGDPGGVCAASNRNLQHESETALDQYANFDFTIHTECVTVNMSAAICCEYLQKKHLNAIFE